MGEIIPVARTRQTTPGPAAVAWAGLAGFADATLLTLILALPSLLAVPADVPRLSAAVFTVS